MDRAPARSSAPVPDVPLLISLYTLEVSALLVTLALHTRVFARSLLSLDLALFFIACLGLVGGAAVIVRRWRRQDRRRLVLTAVLNVLPVLLLLVVGELAVRMLSRPTARGPVFMGTNLLPWQWSDVVAQNEAILRQAAANGSFLMPDERLGWVINPGRRTADGLYFSSVEGLRSPQAGVAFADRKARHRVALVGDSFTFGLEVSYEQSWGARLERALGGDVQVLNFGVDGYGVDQAYLRYTRDVRPWRPDVVIFGLITHDLFRSMAVYSFVSFPGWPFPFAKPRFVADGDRLALLNVPLPSPRAILAARSIGDLPFVEYDRGYRAEDWVWHPLDQFYLYRLLASEYRGWSGRDPRGSDERVVALNREIVRAFIRDVRADGSIPVVVYFPSRLDFPHSSPEAAWQSLAQTMLREADIPHTDLTACLAGLDPADRFGPGHYAPGANAAVADCLRDELSNMGGLERAGLLDMGGLERAAPIPRALVAPRGTGGAPRWSARGWEALRSARP